MTLYEIEAAIRSCMDEETGEVLDFDELEQLDLARETKIENTALYIKNKLAEYEAIKKEADILSNRAKAKKAEAERAKERLSTQLAGEKFESARVKLSYIASKTTEVVNQEALLEWLEEHDHTDCITYTAPKPNLTEVKKLLKAKEPVPGVLTMEHQNLQIK